MKKIVRNDGFNKIEKGLNEGVTSGKRPEPPPPPPTPKVTPPPAKK